MGLAFKFDFCPLGVDFDDIRVGGGFSLVIDVVTSYGIGGMVVFKFAYFNCAFKDGILDEHEER
ncbi:hypothetical protein BDW69DRAFT_190615 [Aspergillus filifer]